MELIKSATRFFSSRLSVNLIPTSWLLNLNPTFRKTYNFLQETESWTESDALEWQLAKSKSIIIDAYTNTAAYKNLYDLHHISPTDISSLKDIKELPTIDKSFVKSNYNELINKSLKNNESVARYTGGSTGTPMKFLLDKEKILMEKAFFYYFWKKHGYSIGEKCLFIKGENIKWTTGSLTSRDGIYNYLKLDSNYLNDSENLREYDQAIKRFSPKKAFGYPSAIYQLALLYSKSSLRPPEFELIMLASENTYPDQVEFIKNTFSCPKVFFHYGHSEYAALAVKYHENDQLGFIPFYGFTEVINKGKDTEPGKTGEIVSTSYSRSMPLIRYKTNDFAIVSDYKSSDHMRSCLSVESIEGRLQEYIVTSDNRLVSICTMGAAHFEELGPVLDSQYYQEKPGELIFRICCPENQCSPELKANIKFAIEKKLENKASVYVEHVPAITRTAAGKKMMIEQKLDIQAFI
jgi:phenylacetate-CoA ligase